MRQFSIWALTIAEPPFALRPRPTLAESSSAQVAQRAQQLLEHSLLGELRTLVARALSGLDMFDEPQFRELFGGATSPTGKVRRRPGTGPALPCMAGAAACRLRTGAACSTRPLCGQPRHGPAAWRQP